MVFSCKLAELYKKLVNILNDFLKRAINFLKNFNFHKEEHHSIPSINEEISKAYKEWTDARKVFEEINDQLIDYAVFRLNAAERRYMYLLEEAKKQGITAWGERDVNHSQ